MKIGFIGAGNLASALVAGSAKTSFFSENEFYAYDVYQPSLDNICIYGVKPCAGVKELVALSDIVILAVKPKDFPALLTENAEAFKAKNPFIVSVAAGTELKYIKGLLGYDAKLARIMPNINARVQGSATGVCVESNVSAEEKTESESSRIPFQNGNSWWKKSFSSKKSKRKKENFRLGRIYVAFSSMLV